MTQTDQKPGGGLTRTMRIILAVLVVAVLAAGGVYYAMLRDRASTTQASQEAAVGGDILAMVNGEAVTREAVEEIYAYFVDEYGYYYDLDDPDTIAMFWNASIMYAEQNLIMMQKGRELGVLPLTEEEKAEAQAEWQAYVEEYAQQISDLGEDATEEQLAAAREDAVSVLASYGLSAQTFEDEYAEEKVIAAMTQDVAVTEEEIQAAYEEEVEACREAWEEDPLTYLEEYEEAEMYSAYFDAATMAYLGIPTYYYRPEGYRSVQHILLEVDEELLETYLILREELENQLDAAEEASGTDAASATDLITQAELDGAKAAVIASAQDKVAEILERLAAGETFTALMAEYSLDFEQESGEADQCYHVHLDSSTFDPAFVAGAFSLEQPGEISEPVLSSAGVHLIKYVEDLPAGAIELTEELRSQLLSTLQSTKENEKYNETMNAWLAEAVITYSEDGQAMADGTYTTPLS